MLRNRNLPSFLGVGAQKAGTTWLFRQLSNHPEVWMPYLKELDFFNRYPQYLLRNQKYQSKLASYLKADITEKNTERNLQKMKDRFREFKPLTGLWLMHWVFGGYDENWYSRLFLPGIFHKVTGEISPSYSSLQGDDIARIKSVNPQIKIIFMIRHPIERIWSAFRFSIRKGYYKNNFDSDEQIIKCLKQLQSNGLDEYERTINGYLQYFDSQQILVAFYDSIINDPIALMSSVANFLEISPYKDGVISNEKRENASPKREIPDRVKEYLVEYYSPIMENLADRFGSYAKMWYEQGISYQIPANGNLSPSQFPSTFHPSKKIL